MPCHPVKGGWKFGSQPHVFPTKAECEVQAKAIYASGFKESSKKARQKNEK